MFRVDMIVKDLLYLDRLIDVAADPRGIACCRVGLELSRCRLPVWISRSMPFTTQEARNRKSTTGDDPIHRVRMP